MSLQRETLDGGAIVLLRLDRPAQRNAIDRELLDALNRALDELGRDPALRVVVLSTTDSGAFCAGADVNESLSEEQARARMAGFSRLYSALEALPAVSVCVCVGNVLGAGAELAAGSDLRVVGDNVKLGWVGARLGIPVGPARLAPLVGQARAKELIFTGRMLDQAGAQALGLATRAAPAAGCEQAAVELAREVARCDPDGLRRLKRLFSELDGSAQRVAHENSGLERWQRHGPGLPQAGG